MQEVQRVARTTLHSAAVGVSTIVASERLNILGQELSETSNADSAVLATGAGADARAGGADHACIGGIAGGLEPDLDSLIEGADAAVDTVGHGEVDDEEVGDQEAAAVGAGLVGVEDLHGGVVGVLGNHVGVLGADRSVDAHVCRNRGGHGEVLGFQVAGSPSGAVGKLEGLELVDIGAEAVADFGVGGVSEKVDDVLRGGIDEESEFHGGALFAAAGGEGGLATFVAASSESGGD